MNRLDKWIQSLPNHPNYTMREWIVPLIAPLVIVYFLVTFIPIFVKLGFDYIKTFLTLAKNKSMYKALIIIALLLYAAFTYAAFVNSPLLIKAILGLFSGGTFVLTIFYPFIHRKSQTYVRNTGKQ